MTIVQIADNKRTLTRGGEPFFMLADTVWNVFSNASVDEWSEYLRFRKSQNFNTLQISILPVLHDASDTYTGLFPYELNEDGSWNFHQINEAFYDKAETMVRMAFEMGFVPALALLWNNYVPGTWANEKVAEYSMPKETIELYTEYAVKRFAPYSPIYYVSGDTRFETEEVNEYFMIAMKKLKEIQPKALTALHPVGDFHDLPEPFIQSDLLNLYIYQSGHSVENQKTTYELAQSFLQKPITRPIINSEPCYEGHGHGMRYGRFEAFDLRKAFWSSVLSGANAGFTYGAHGVWSWHKEGSGFTSEGWSKMPFDWRSALRLQGAWDVGYARWLFEQHHMFDLEPRQDLLLTPYPEIRVAAAADLGKIVIYAPYSNNVLLNLDLTSYKVKAVTLQDRYIYVPDIIAQDQVGSKIAMIQSNTDAVIVAEIAR